MPRDIGTTQFLLHLLEEINAKVRVIAAYRAVSINTVITESVTRWHRSGKKNMELL